MRRVAILVAASPTRAFCSQLAVVSRSLFRLPWSTWQPSLHVYFGGPVESGALESWASYLSGVDMHFTSPDRFETDGDWAQSDDVFRFAPGDADMLLALDADTLVVGDLQPLLNEVDELQAVAGVIAHYPTYLPHSFDRITRTFTLCRTVNGSSLTTRDAWRELARGLIREPLDFGYEHTLMDERTPEQDRRTPFYPNFGLVLFPRNAFDRVAPEYLRIRPQLMTRLPAPDFSGQAALTLATAAVRAKTAALPLRYNFPNDPVAEQIHADEARQVVVFHYLRTETFDRHEIFLTADAYDRFLRLELHGINRSFQRAVRDVLGDQFPFR